MGPVEGEEEGAEPARKRIIDSKVQHLGIQHSKEMYVKRERETDREGQRNREIEETDKEKNIEPRKTDRRERKERMNEKQTPRKPKELGKLVKGGIGRYCNEGWGWGNDALVPQ